MALRDLFLRGRIERGFSVRPVGFSAWRCAQAGSGFRKLVAKHEEGFVCQQSGESANQNGECFIADYSGQNAQTFLLGAAQ